MHVLGAFDASLRYVGPHESSLLHGLFFGTQYAFRKSAAIR